MITQIMRSLWTRFPMLMVLVMRITEKSGCQNFSLISMNGNERDKECEKIKNQGLSFSLINLRERKFIFHKRQVLQGVHIWARRKTKSLIKREFFWPDMNHKIDKFVKECRECQLAKQLLNNKIGTYSVALPSRPWTLLQLDN
ncbi:hypothetical protein PR048_004947 [Dryococelus australis]|uniref:RNA-directed DNA polymerase n=1 Tax=Dryococelus australis TaxID=614101 RepID=A0ABQ9I6U6_9NEOP|nr:hypothetical protein PR048_004947 [Dryococelus australis]